MYKKMLGILLVVVLIFQFSTPVLANTAPKKVISWAGSWTTSFGIVTIKQSGNKITGTYVHDKGKITGTVSGNKVTGTWSEAPSYKAPNDAGKIIFTLSSDGKSFNGKWCYSNSKTWSTWNGKLNAKVIVKPVTKKQEAWVLVNTIDDEVSNVTDSNIWTYNASYEKDSIAVGWTSVSTKESLSVGFKWDAPPKIIKSGELVTIKISVLPTKSQGWNFPGTISAFAYFDVSGLESGKETSKKVSFINSQGLSSSKCAYAGGTQMSNIIAEVSGKAFEPGKLGDKMSLYYGVYTWSYGTEYIYEWKAYK